MNHTPLKWADLHRNKDMIIQLIKNGADVTLKDDQYGQSWVFRLIMKYKDLDILNAMLIRGVDVKYLNEKNNFNMTLLSEAAIFNNKDLLNLLVENGADVSALYKRYQSKWVCFLEDEVLINLIKENIHKDEFQMMLLDSKPGSNLFTTGFRNLINCFGKHTSKNEMYKNLITLNKVLDLIPDDVMEYYDNKTQFYNYYSPIGDGYERKSSGNFETFAQYIVNYGKHISKTEDIGSGTQAVETSELINLIKEISTKFIIARTHNGVFRAPKQCGDDCFFSFRILANSDSVYAEALLDTFIESSVNIHDALIMSENGKKMIESYNENHNDVYTRLTHDGDVLMKQITDLLLTKKTKAVSKSQKEVMENEIAQHEQSVEKFHREFNVFNKFGKENIFSGPLKVCQEIKRKHDEL